MTEQPKRKRLTHSLQSSNVPRSKLFPSTALQPASDADKANWHGFCEIESEPALFNVMLREFGVKGIKVQEVFSLDDELLAFLPRPIYGLVFLFKWREEDPDKQEQSCPDGVWFANQTVDNACASVALLNIVNNIPNVELGEHLQQFRSFTAGLTPALRGDAISNFSFVKQIHNSFARKLDMLNCDLHMKNTAKARKKGKGGKATTSDSEAGFHFIAYVPIDGNIWKFDGLERQPQKLGQSNGMDWITEVKPDIEARMASYDEGAGDFVLMSLVHDPLVSLVAALAENVRANQAATSRSERSNSLRPKSMTNGDCSKSGPTGLVLGPDPAYDLTQTAIDHASVPERTLTILDDDDCEKIVEHQSELIATQTAIRASIRGELDSRRADEEKADGRRFDFGPLALKMARILARKRVWGKKRKQRKRQRK